MFDRFHDPIVCKVPYEVVTPGPPAGSSKSLTSIPLPDSGFQL